MDELTQHEYDGIQEYNNSLPLWWVGLFLITIIFAVGYFIYYEFGPGLSQEQLLALELKAEALKEASKPKVSAGESELLALISNSEALAKGKEVYVAKCLACHLTQGQGLVGPNLTDDYWIHGGKISDIKNVVTNGVLEKGMLAWKTMMSEQEINAVTAYIWTLHGTNPPNPKAPQGELVPRS